MFEKKLTLEAFLLYSAECSYTDQPEAESNRMFFSNIEQDSTDELEHQKQSYNSDTDNEQIYSSSPVNDEFQSIPPVCHDSSLFQVSAFCFFLFHLTSFS